MIDLEVTSLPTKMRAVFQLSRYEDLSNKAIAETLNIAEGTVKKQVKNALTILRERLAAVSTLMVFIVWEIFS
ncbi:sigma factor-like helix-turn-helix DNA-binding protein [Chitinophaga sancti]|uniref:RNA polymerase sigma factor, sigma-70 family n=1 Tax=Chitinophaga sancti TaxID=1004 RepID=A0A1K1SZM8_9BACT|nr:sigma factor-like helix-turn-helix DNA-binding protein [Chitinophaga sancti]WQD65382.1 sigma factor-like helix-turn-helix DNA-binding protein [Chitinophaga sancti]WQG88994.1 sigma factor-like helix-turn-helix DNA-binding protein [Chitinophaga sancti]SFW89808.1 RNA polymerase sigma factor, sigma-70 family [Chitinophaga sancti]